MEPFGQFHHPVNCVILDVSTGSLTVALQTGEIAVCEGKSHGESQHDILIDTEGCPTGVAFDTTGRLFIADMGHKAILTFADGEQITNIVDNYEGIPFLGPNSLCHRSDGSIFFTDSEHEGVTTLAKPNGSLFVITGSDRILLPILKDCLAHPAGVCLSPDEKHVYVAETLRNQIIRLARSQHSSNVFHASVFYRFSGGLGPVSLSVDSNGNLFVAHADLPDGGQLSVLSPDGHLLGSVGADQISAVACPIGKERFVYIAAANSIYKVPSDHFM